MSNNVFEDLGFDKEEATNLSLRASLMIEIREVIKKRKWTQARTAKELGITQSRVSYLLSSRIDKFSVDALVNFLTKLNMEVKLTVKRRKQKAA